MARHAGPSELPVEKLQQVEDALIGSLMEAHPNRQRAMERLMHDVYGAGGDGRSGVRPPLCVSAPENAPARLLRIEELLVAAVLGRDLEHHQSLDRLLRRLGECDLEQEQAAGTDGTAWDTDFDGLG